MFLLGSRKSSFLSVFSTSVSVFQVSRPGNNFSGFVPLLFCAFENLVILELLKTLDHRVCPRSEGFDPQTISFTFYFADHRAYLDDTRLGLEPCDRANTKQVNVGWLEVQSFFLNSITSCQSLFTLRGKTFGLGALIKNKKRL